MLLAGDIGGTKTLLGLFEPAAPRPRPVVVRNFATLEHDDLPSMIREFIADGAASATVTAACFGVAGPVIDEEAELTNVPWRVEAQARLGVVRDPARRAAQRSRGDGVRGAGVTGR